MSELASRTDQLTKPEVQLLECLNSCDVASLGGAHGGNHAGNIDDCCGAVPLPRRQVEWLLDASSVVWLLEIGAEMAATGEGPAVFDRAASLLGWRPDDDQDDDQEQNLLERAPRGGADGARC